jgi:hypothetical protein
MVQTRTAPRSKTSSSRFRHNDYKPFLKYIERQSINNINKIDHAEKSQKIKNKLSSISSNLDNNNNSNNNNNKNSITKNIIMSSVNSSSSSNGFNIQKSNAAYKAKKKNDDRHKDLHANTKTKDFTDSDKIFLLKREIDNLRGQQIIDSSSYRSVEQQKFTSNSSGVTTTNNSNAMAYKVPMFTVMLAFGVLLVASKYLKRKLNQIRSSDSLLMANYNSQDDETNMVELRSSYTHTSGSSSSSSSLSTEQPQIFVIDSNNDEEQSSSVPAAAAAAYKAPSETSGAGAGAAGADMQFV